MKRKLQLAIILCTIVVLSAIISQSLMAWLKIAKTGSSHWEVGPVGGRTSVFLGGSSLAWEGLSWEQISDVLHWRIEGWMTPGSSPCEWEHFQSLTTQTNMTVLVVSVYDLNEYFLCDFRAEIPLERTIKDLWQARSDRSFSKRLISLYPLTYLRKLFPTAGRSDGVMAGGREKFKKLVSSFVAIESETVPTLSSGKSASNSEGEGTTISIWDSSRMFRRIAALRDGCQGRHEFNGPKKLSFLRMLSHAKEQGSLIVVVLPVSPAYSNEFLTANVKSRFEAALTEAQHSVPQARWVRLDQLDELNSDEYFWDLVHMNTCGQKIATEAFLGRLHEFKELL